MSLASPVSAQTLVFSAKVDKTTTAIGEPLNLTLTLSGDVTGVQLPELTFPDSFAILGRSQSTNFSISAGVIERSLSLNVVLVPQQAGTFQLGPFQMERQKAVFKTEPIEITVKKSALPPNLKPHGERFSL